MPDMNTMSPARQTETGAPHFSKLVSNGSTWIRPLGTMDKAGNLYGTTHNSNAGPRHRLSAEALQDPVGSLTHSTASVVASDGSKPAARVIFGPNGTLYGTTE